jgi:hypothetical protein
MARRREPSDIQWLTRVRGFEGQLEWTARRRWYQNRMPSPLASLARSTAPGAIRLSELARLFSEEEGRALAVSGASCCFARGGAISPAPGLGQCLRAAAWADRQPVSNGSASLARGARGFPGAALPDRRARPAGWSLRDRARSLRRHSWRGLFSRPLSLVPRRPGEMVGAAHALRRQPARNRGWGSGAATRQARDVKFTFDRDSMR